MWILGSGAAAECVVAQVGASRINGICVEDNFFTPNVKLLGWEVVPLSRARADGASEIFVATGYKSLNRRRAQILCRMNELGAVIPNVLPANLCSTVKVDGHNNFIMKGCAIHPYARIGTNCFIWSGATVCHHVTLGNNIWITAGAVVAGNSTIGSNVFIGANATICNNVQVGNNVFIGAGALVTQDVPDNSAIALRASEYLPVDADTFVNYLDALDRY